MYNHSHKRIVIVLAAAALISLTACSSIKKELGVDRNSPDEFTVLKRAPLTLPPDYTLRPPMAPGEMPDASEATAKTTILGRPAAPAVAGAADNALLQKIGADTSNPGIRRQIDEDNGFLLIENQSVADKLIALTDENAEPNQEKVPASVVNAKEEAERLKKNKEEGKPLNEGDVPVIEKKKNTLQKIF